MNKKILNIIVIVILLILLITGIIILYINKDINLKSKGKNENTSNYIENINEEEKEVLEENELIQNNEIEDEIIKKNTTIVGIAYKLKDNRIFINENYDTDGNQNYIQVPEYMSTLVYLGNKKEYINFITNEKEKCDDIVDGDIIIAHGDLVKLNGDENLKLYNDSNSLLIFKKSDFEIKKNDLINKNNANIKIQYIHEEVDEKSVVLKYVVKHKNKLSKIENFPFFVIAEIADETKIEGILKEGKEVKVEYKEGTEKVTLKKITIQK